MASGRSASGPGGSPSGWAFLRKELGAVGSAASGPIAAGLVVDQRKRLLELEGRLQTEVRDQMAAKKRLSKELSSLRNTVTGADRRVQVLRNKLSNLTLLEQQNRQKKAQMNQRIDEVLLKAETSRLALNSELHAASAKASEARATLAYLEAAQDVIAKGGQGGALLADLPKDGRLSNVSATSLATGSSGMPAEDETASSPMTVTLASEPDTAESPQFPQQKAESEEEGDSDEAEDGRNSPRPMERELRRSLLALEQVVVLSASSVTGTAPSSPVAGELPRMQPGAQQQYLEESYTELQERLQSAEALNRMLTEELQMCDKSSLALLSEELQLAEESIRVSCGREAALSESGADLARKLQLAEAACPELGTGLLAGLSAELSLSEPSLLREELRLAEASLKVSCSRESYALESCSALDGKLQRAEAACEGLLANLSEQTPQPAMLREELKLAEASLELSCKREEQLSESCVMLRQELRSAQELAVELRQQLPRACEELPPLDVWCTDDNRAALSCYAQLLQETLSPTTAEARRGAFDAAAQRLRGLIPPSLS